MNLHINTFIGLDINDCLIGKCKNWVIAICDNNTYIFTNLNKAYIKLIENNDRMEIKKCKKWKRGKRSKR